MAHESIYELMRPGFPEERLGEDSYLTVIEYVGLIADLSAASPPNGTTWGEHPGVVSDQSIKPEEGTDYGKLTVTVERKFSNDSSGGDNGTLQEVTTEIDWLTVQRSLYQHPKFIIGGGGTYELTNEDKNEIERWEAETNVETKSIYQYRGDDGLPIGFPLSTNARMFARGIELGCDPYDDKAPIARVSMTYVNGPGPVGHAGQKETPSGIPNLPTGYEWVRATDRSVKSGGQLKWQRDIEWTGEKKVLVDKDETFWTAP
ncbi:MAG: hypothetical protein ABIS50_13965 [Luteolibacter sp.]|uniref:hypothetical protein n=1 Tax=Luteolibacter sp. TaxID=1962973 RepID=UPI0032662569